MKKTAIFSALLFFIAFTSSSQAPSLQWVKNIGSTSNEQANDVAVDAAGNVYVTGSFSGAADFDPGPGTFSLTSNGFIDLFISKFDPSGNFIWTKQIGGGQNDVGFSIALDPSANIYIAGYFNSLNTDFDPNATTFTMSPYASSDGFVCKLDANGNFIWAKKLGGFAIDYAYAVALDGSNNVYTAGYFTSFNADFDPGPGTYTLSTAGGNDVYISKLDNSGNFVWARSFGGATQDYCYGIAVDNPGNVYTTGYYQSTAADFDPGTGTFTLSPIGQFDIFISKLDVSGNFSWAKSIGGTLDDQGSGITVDGSGDVYTTGYFQTNADFDPGVSTFTMGVFGSEDIFISKLDASGNFVWAKQLGGLAFDRGNAITLDVAGNCYTTGYFQSMPGDFDPGPAVANFTAQGGTPDIFVSKLDASGNYIWAARMGGGLTDEAKGIAVDAAGRVYTTGRFIGTCDFDPTASTFTVMSNGNEDIFIHKMNQGSTGINEDFSSSFLNIYPNPANGTFYFELDLYSGIVITNVLGQEILNEKRNSGKQTIDLQDQSNGIYFVKIIQEGKQYITKIVKE